MYAIGDAVSLVYGGDRQIGEIVGVLWAQGERLYDVSLEEIVVKAVEEAEIAPIYPDQIKSLLTAMVSSPGPKTTRGRAVLRQRYAAFLTQTLDRMEQEREGMQAAGDALFDVGQTVAVLDDNSFSLGVVCMVSRSGDGIRYEVDVLGETLRVGESSLADLACAEMGTAYRLGSRARFVAEGYEGDEAFAGAICKVERTEEEYEYSLMFDDGDILEGLSAADLELCPD